MTGNRALLMNFVEKFLETVHFGNNDFAVIVGYRDVVIGSMTIKIVYYVEGLGHNLFNVRQFCDKGLEVAFIKSTFFVRTEDGFFFTILVVASTSFTLNFTTINNLVKNNLVQDLPKMKFEKDHLFSSCEQGKIHQKHHKSKTTFASNKPLYLLHMDFCGPRRVESINGKRYVLVVVDDYSWYTWVFFLHSKDEASEKRFDKTPYELMNKRKPNIKFFHVFGCICHILNDYEDVRNLKVKGDIRVFVGYSKEFVAFRIYNKRTRKIHGSMNVNFDEISKMASKQFNLDLGLSNLNETGKSSTPSVLQVS
nr:hypothetical protein [Tanacetum cinerariifolium]